MYWEETDWNELLLLIRYAITMTAFTDNIEVSQLVQTKPIPYWNNIWWYCEANTLICFAFKWSNNHLHDSFEHFEKTYKNLVEFVFLYILSCI